MKNDIELLIEAYESIYKESDSNDINIQNVLSWKDAENILKEKGYGIVKTYVHPVWQKARHFADPGERTFKHIYFANSEGKEVGYYTPDLKTLIIFNTPRNVNPLIMKNAEHPETSWINPDSVKRANQQANKWKWK